MVEDKIRNLLEDSITREGYILSDVTYGKEGSVNTLTIVIDKEGSIDINDCLKVNKIINPILDEADPICESYVLDVCSKEKGCE